MFRIKLRTLLYTELYSNIYCSINNCGYLAFGQLMNGTFIWYVTKTVLKKAKLRNIKCSSNLDTFFKILYV